jgi:hypothetical protein
MRSHILITLISSRFLRVSSILQYSEINVFAFCIKSARQSHGLPAVLGSVSFYDEL